MWYCSRFSSSKPRRGDTHSAVSVSSQALRRSVGQDWSWLITSAIGWKPRIFSSVSQRWRASRPSSQASSAEPTICTLLGWMTLR